MPEVKSVFLLRHGETKGAQEGTYYGRTDHILSENGVRQAQAAGKRLERVKFDAIYVSPLRRCVQTARLLSLDTKIVQAPGFNEIDFGLWEGIEISKAMEDQAAWQAWIGGGIHGAPPEGESIEMLHERTILAFEQMLNENPGSCTLLVVAHHATLRSIMAYALGLGAEGARSFRCAPGSIGVVEIVDGVAVLTRWNA